MRESAATRARRLLIEGRVIVTTAKDDYVAADVRGSGAVHLVEHHPGDGWTCSCPAGQHRRTCAHVEALKLVSAPIRPEEP